MNATDTWNSRYIHPGGASTKDFHLLWQICTHSWVQGQYGGQTEEYDVPRTLGQIFEVTEVSDRIIIYCVHQMVLSHLTRQTYTRI
jgi:hypothetical protein